MKFLFYTFSPLLLVIALFFTQASSSTIVENNSRITMIELSSGYIIARAIHVAAAIKVADFMIDGPQTISYLALQTQTNPSALYRLLRLLASYTIFKENDDCTFSLTPLALHLISTNADSLWAWINYHHDSNRWLAYSEMEQSIKSGIPAFNSLFGKGFFNFIAEDPLLAQQFDEGMKNISMQEDIHIVSSYDFSSYRSIVDIGGGTGSLLTHIIKNNESTHGIIFDLPHVQNTAKKYLTSHNVNHLIGFVSSTGFFDPIPQHKELYILKRILHDWNDQDCITILNNCHAAMDNNARLLIIDAIVSAENIRDIKKDIDIEMMVLFGGKERTKNEWITLLNSTNFELIAIHTTPSLLSIIEIQKK